MPLPHVIAQLNKRFTNRFIQPVVQLLPGFILVEHRGRKTGVVYSTPLYAVLRTDSSVLVALTYGERSDWAQNVIARGGVVQSNDRSCTIESTTIVPRREIAGGLAVPVRLGSWLLRINQFIELTVSTGHVGRTQPDGWCGDAAR